MKKSELEKLITQMPGVEVKFFLSGDPEEMRMESITLYIDDGRTVINFRIRDPKRTVWIMEKSELEKLIKLMPGEDVKLFLSGDPVEMRIASISYYINQGCTVIDFRKKEDEHVC